MPGTLYRFWAEDHARLEGLLQGSMTETGRVNRAAYAEVRAGLLTHISMEEKTLLPAAPYSDGPQVMDIVRRALVRAGYDDALLT